MWIFTVDGFFSVVEKRSDKGSGKVHVRARVREDLVRFCAMMKIRNKIFFDDRADYPYRVITSNVTWARYLERSALEIDYDNFKSCIKARHGAQRETVYLQIWSLLQRLEARRAPAGQPGLFYDEPADTLGDLHFGPPGPAARVKGGKKGRGYNPKYPYVWESNRF